MWSHDARGLSLANCITRWATVVSWCHTIPALTRGASKCQNWKRGRNIKPKSFWKPYKILAKGFFIGRPVPNVFCVLVPSCNIPENSNILGKWSIRIQRAAWSMTATGVETVLAIPKARTYQGQSRRSAFKSLNKMENNIWSGPVMPLAPFRGQQSSYQNQALSN